MCVWRVLRFTIYLLVIMVALATAREFVDKRTPEDRQSWFLGSRYGRSSSQSSGSGGGGGGGNNGVRRLVVTARRDDRFHPGSRYGKRTVSMTDLDSDVADNSGNIAHQQDVECSYTGVADLYRCHVHVRKENMSGEFVAN